MFDHDLDGTLTVRLRHGVEKQGNHLLMKKRETATHNDDPSEIDDRLRPLLTADGEQYQVLLQEVIEKHAEPLIQKIIGAKLHVSSTEAYDHSEAEVLEDFCQEAILKLVAYLNQSRQKPQEYCIKSLDDFVATTAFNVYNKYLREKYPLRYKLKRQLYYLLNNRKALALWKEGHEFISGLSKWRERRPAERHSQALWSLREDDSKFVTSRLKGRAPSELPPDSLLIHVFQWLGHSLELNLLVDVVAELLKIKDQPITKTPEEDENKRVAQNHAHHPGPLTRIEHQQILKQLWEEIEILRVNQRWALLCSLRDEQGNGLITFFPSCGIASPRQIAQTLKIEIEELMMLWDKFPLKDSEIAARLGVSTQQVINLRKSARERLERRIRKANQ
ncbi:MAG TPA: hypothetical protein PLD20_31590 [Blastocatellia bacterium]|nr:hypothetical protein [Blastocatellia bacterium]HMZ22516.1 hypothetical protein [Blastocatellia bacterium]HNG29511.1 hypothetical protein [Blastocatellia bacterium]